MFSNFFFQVKALKPLLLNIKHSEILIFFFFPNFMFLSCALIFHIAVLVTCTYMIRFCFVNLK